MSLSVEKQSLFARRLHLQIILHVEACHTADFHGNLLVKSLPADWHHCNNTCYYSQPSCNTNFSEICAERCQLTAPLFGLNHLRCSCCYFETHHRTSNRQHGSIIKPAATETLNTLKRNSHGAETIKNLLKFKLYPKIVLSKNGNIYNINVSLLFVLLFKVEALQGTNKLCILEPQHRLAAVF